MKTKFFLFFLGLLLNIPFCQSQQINDSFFVINIKGAKIYEKPTFKSKTNHNISLGKSILVEKIIPTKEVFEISKNFSLKGSWIKPKGVDGYVFSSDFSMKKPNVFLKHERLKSINFRGESLRETKEKGAYITADSESISIEYEYTFYPNAKETYYSLDGCFYEIVEYRNLTLNEVYHQMISDTREGLESNKFYLLDFVSRSENEIIFQGQLGVDEVYLRIKENGLFEVEITSCT
ncbi:hypothetical protein [Aureivirga sp. CE67]|uniref:hypothetical protein n=1 Tax=Aureivirga sp. CE67 TaxID=1788983 RepID=UPI0018CB78D2|nr:hypothetical protein [Aureivirga sp. CE67]